MILAIVLMFIGNSSKDHWVVFTRSLQLIIIMPMISVAIPSINLELYSGLDLIAFYDVLKEYNIWRNFTFLKFKNMNVLIIT
jgi:hypothetical protein